MGQLNVEHIVGTNFLIRPDGVADFVTARSEAGVVGVPLTDMRTWDALATNVVGTAGNDDLALVTGTPGTNAPSIQTGDLKNAGATTRKVGFEFKVPEWYIPGSTITLSMEGGMTTTVASASCTVDCNAYVEDYANNDGTMSGDLCATAAQSINSLTFATVSFVIDDDATGYVIAPGDVLQFILSIACNDSGTGTAVIGTLRDIRVTFSE